MGMLKSGKRLGRPFINGVRHNAMVGGKKVWATGSLFPDHPVFLFNSYTVPTDPACTWNPLSGKILLVMDVSDWGINPLIKRFDSNTCLPVKTLPNNTHNLNLLTGEKKENLSGIGVSSGGSTAINRLPHRDGKFFMRAGQTGFVETSDFEEFTLVSSLWSGAGTDPGSSSHSFILDTVGGVLGGYMGRNGLSTPIRIINTKTWAQVNTVPTMGKNNTAFRFPEAADSGLFAWELQGENAKRHIYSPAKGVEASGAVMVTLPFNTTGPASLEVHGDYVYAAFTGQIAYTSNLNPSNFVPIVNNTGITVASIPKLYTHKGGMYASGYNGGNAVTLRISGGVVAEAITTPLPITPSQSVMVWREVLP